MNCVFHCLTAFTKFCLWRVLTSTITRTTGRWRQTEGNNYLFSTFIYVYLAWEESGKMTLEIYINNEKMRKPIVSNACMNNGVGFHSTVHFYIWPRMCLFWRTRWCGSLWSDCPESYRWARWMPWSWRISWSRERQASVWTVRDTFTKQCQSLNIQMWTRFYPKLIIYVYYKIL